MKKRNKWLALLLTAAMAVSVAACGNSSASGGAAQNTTAETEETEAEEEVPKIDPLAAARENVAGVTSMDAKMTMEMDMETGIGEVTQTMESNTVMEMSSFTDPMKMKAEMTMDVNMGEDGNAAQTMEIYAEETEDGAYMMYLCVEDEWVSQEVAIEDIARYDAGSDMEAYLDEAYQYEAQGMDQVDGASAYQYSGVIVGDDMKEVLLSSGALDQLSQMGIDSTQWDGMLDNLGEISIDMWIDEATLYPVKYEIDVTEVMGTLMSRLTEAMAEPTGGVTMNVTKMTMSMTCFNYNAATEFEIPQEAKAN